jgi:hypothetical protein
LEYGGDFDEEWGSIFLRKVAAFLFHVVCTMLAILVYMALVVYDSILDHLSWALRYLGRSDVVVVVFLRVVRMFSVGSNGKCARMKVYQEMSCWHRILYPKCRN